MPKKVEFERKRGDLRYDSGKWIGWQTDIRDSAGRRRRDTFPTKAAAEQFEQSIRDARKYSKAGMKAPQPAREISLGELIDARLEAHTARKQIEFERRVLTYFENLVGRSKLVEEVTLTDLRNFVKQRSREMTVRREPVKPQTVDRELTIIAAMLHSGPAMFEELADYVAPRIPHPKFKKGRREREITEEESERLIAHLRSTNEQVANILEFALLTGMRHAEIMRVRKTDINRRARSLKVYRSKTDSTSHIAPLTDRMLELLQGEREFIFTKDGKTPPTFYKGLRKACAACDIPYGRFKEGGIILHDMRHTFISKLNREGVDLPTIGSFTGHSDETMVLHYSHARPDSRKRAMDIIDGKNHGEKLRSIYDQTVAGKLTFEAFVEALK